MEAGPHFGTGLHLRTYFTLRKETTEPAPSAETAALEPIPVAPAAIVIVPVFCTALAFVVLWVMPAKVGTPTFVSEMLFAENEEVAPEAPIEAELPLPLNNPAAIVPELVIPAWLRLVCEIAPKLFVVPEDELAILDTEIELAAPLAPMETPDPLPDRLPVVTVLPIFVTVALFVGACVT